MKLPFSQVMVEIIGGPTGLARSADVLTRRCDGECLH
jgi:hypothetical protein